MSTYGKKLHIIKNGTQEDIELYTTAAEAGGNVLCLSDGGTTVYAGLAAENAATASSLRVSKNGTTFAVLRNVVQSTVAGIALIASGGGSGTWKNYEGAQS